MSVLCGQYKEMMNGLCEIPIIQSTRHPNALIVRHEINRITLKNREELVYGPDVETKRPRPQLRDPNVCIMWRHYTQPQKSK